MKKIVTASSNEEVISTVKNSCKSFEAFFHTEFFSDTEAVISFINYEMPEIKVLDYTSANVDCEKILTAVRNDSWLHYGGIIAICKDRKTVHEMEEKKDENILAILTISDFKEHFARLLRILFKNQQFLYTRGMQDNIGGQEKGSFVCGNDPLDLRFYANFLIGYLYNTNRISEDDRISLQMTLMELLTNAVEHGNLNISYQDKSEWLQKGGDILSLIAERSRMPEYKNRKVRISYIIRKEASAFRIEDDGDGFDWRAMEKLTEEKKTETHGRGISLSRQCVKKLVYNDKGNQVTFSIANRQDTVNSVPSIMNSFEVKEYKDKEVVFRQDDLSNDLFFIVSGRFAVYVNGTLNSVLTTSDMFIGEMAFLLDDRRTATIVSVGSSKVIKVPKNAFLSLIRKNPHYGIFLSKMLAQRLVLQSQNAYVIQQKLNEMQTMLKA